MAQSMEPLAAGAPQLGVAPLPMALATPMAMAQPMPASGPLHHPLQQGWLPPPSPQQLVQDVAREAALAQQQLPPAAPQQQYGAALPPYRLWPRFWAPSTSLPPSPPQTPMLRYLPPNLALVHHRPLLVFTVSIAIGLVGVLAQSVTEQCDHGLFDCAMGGGNSGPSMLLVASLVGLAFRSIRSMGRMLLVAVLGWSLAFAVVSAWVDVDVLSAQWEVIGRWPRLALVQVLSFGCFTGVFVPQAVRWDQMLAFMLLGFGLTTAGVIAQTARMASALSIKTMAPLTVAFQSAICLGWAVRVRWFQQRDFAERSAAHY